jgi:hypothetical protein
LGAAIERLGAAMDIGVSNALISVQGFGAILLADPSASTVLYIRKVPEVEE